MRARQPDPFFTGAGLDRADALRADQAALEDLAGTPQARSLRWDGGLPSVDANGRLEWSEPEQPELFLGLAEGVAFFSSIEDATGDARLALPRMALLDHRDAPLFATALSLSRWHSRHRFCATCGQMTKVNRGGWSRCCPSCATEHYPRVDPVVIMVAEYDGKLLLGRQHHYPLRRYSALAGFVEVGETVEAAVARELFEEAGIRVDNVRYIASQPWPFPSSLMLGCHADALTAEITIDKAELEDARWFGRDEVEAALDGRSAAPFEAPPPMAIARTLLERWLSA